MPTEINIVTSADDQFAVGIAGTIKSALCHLSRRCRLNLYVLDGGISDDNKAALVAHWNDPRLTVQWIPVNRHEVSGMHVSDHVTDATYYRLLAPELLPVELKRFIFLDADLLVRHDLAEMWQVSMDGLPCLAVQDIGAPFIDSAIALAEAEAELLPLLVNPRPIPNYRELGLSPTDAYFNGGVMVVDLEMWRRERLGRRMLQLLIDEREHVTYWDQYALNAVLSGRWKALDPRWNQNAYMFRVPEWQATQFCTRDCPTYVRNPWIVHYNWLKPWQAECAHPLADEFLHYLRGSKWHVSLTRTNVAPSAPKINNQRQWIRQLVSRFKPGAQLSDPMALALIGQRSAAARLRAVETKNRDLVAAAKQRYGTISFAHGAVKDLVSIIIPAYRAEHFIGEALASVARQTYPNWEVIVLEDGSDGTTRAIVEEFARNHPWHRVDYERLDNHHGVSHARNVAFSKAHGEYVAPLDADDRWFPDHLATSLDALRGSNADIAYSSSVMVHDQSEQLLGVWGPDGSDLNDFPHGLFRQNYIIPSATVLRRAVLDDVGAWNTELVHCEDLDYWLRCIGAGKRFQYVGGCHCLYRKNHAGAATHRTCLVLETYAQVIEQYMRLPGLRRKTIQKYTSRAYARAAEFHRKSDPGHDPSADRSRRAKLLLHAWWLRPKHVEYLWKGSMLSVSNLFRRRRPTLIASPPQLDVTNPESRAAA